MGGESKSILIVDDEELNRDALARRLKGSLQIDPARIIGA